MSPVDFMYFYVKDFFILLFLELVMLVLFTTNPRIGSRRDRIRVLSLMAICLALSVAREVDTIFSDVSLYPYTNMPRAIGTYLTYVLGVASLLLFFELALPDTRKVLLLAIPLALMAILYLTIIIFPTAENPLVVGFGTDNVFRRGPLGFTSHTLSIIYTLSLMGVIIRSAGSARRVDTLVIVSCGIGVMYALAIETLDIATNVLYPTILISTVVWVLYSFMKTARHDTLTKLMNRLTFLDDEMRENGSVCAVISIDMNGLKQINDAKGHIAGDDGLRAIGSVLERFSNADCRMYRTGGDEFTALCRKMDEGAVRRICDDVRDGVMQKGYSVSIGYAMRTPGMSVEDAYKAADAAMYESKRAYYQREGNDRRKHRA